MFIGFKNGLQFIVSAKETELAGPDVTWKQAPNGFDQSVHAAKLDENDNVIIVPQSELEEAKHSQELRIQRILPRKYTDAEVLHNNYTIGPKKVTPERDRGRKIKAKYVCQETGDLIVDKTFEDIENINAANATVLDLKVTHNWYREDGTIGLTKEEIVYSFSKTEAAKLYQGRRIAAINFLVSEVKGTPFETHIDNLMNHYHLEIESYLSPQGSSAFADAIKAETDPTILAILSSQVPFSGDPANFTIPVKESILYQIHDITQQEMLAALQPVSS